MHIIDRLFSLPPGDIAAQHLPDDRARANDGDLHDQVVKIFGPRTRQEIYLGTALYLEHPDRVGILQGLVNQRVVLGQFGEVDLLAAVFLDERQCVADNGHHAEPQQIDLDYAEPLAIVLVPLDDVAVLHRSGLERHDAVETPERDDHSARMLAEVAWKIERAGVHLHI